MVIVSGISSDYLKNSSDMLHALANSFLSSVVFKPVNLALLTLSTNFECGSRIVHFLEFKGLLIQALVMPVEFSKILISRMRKLMHVGGMKAVSGPTVQLKTSLWPMWRALRFASDTVSTGNRFSLHRDI